MRGQRRRSFVVRWNLAEDALVVVAVEVVVAPGPRVVVAGLVRQQRLVVFVRVTHAPKITA